MVRTIPKFKSPKVNLIAQLEFELTYYDVTIYGLSHDATGTLQKKVIFTVAHEGFLVGVFFFYEIE